MKPKNTRTCALLYIWINIDIAYYRQFLNDKGNVKLNTSCVNTYE